MNLRLLVPSIICISLVLAFFCLIVINSVNIPQGDDFYCLLFFTQEFQDASGLTERLRLLTDQWVEHRIVYSRFTALLSYWLTGQVNFITVILIGNFTLIAFTWLFRKILRQAGLSMYYLIPVILILFSPVTYEANLWSGASTVYMPVAFLGLLTIYLLVFGRNGSNNLLLAFLAAVLATFSFGNGMFALFSGLAVLLYKRSYRIAFLWGTATVAAIFIYFRNFARYSSTDAFGVSAHFQKPAYLFYNLFGFTGGILDYSENINAPVIAANIPALLLGLSILLAIGFFSFRFIQKKISASETSKTEDLRVAWLGMTVFILLTTLAIAYSRTDGAAMNTLSSRYKIYSMLLWLLVYFGCLVYFSQKRAVGWIFGASSLALLLFNYYTHYDKFVNYKSLNLSGVFNYTSNDTWVIYRRTSYYERSSKAISDSISSSVRPVYTFPAVFPQLTHDAIARAPTLHNVSLSENDEAGQYGKHLTIYSDEYPSSVPVSFQGVYLVVYNDESIYLLPANPLKNGRMNMLTTGRYFKKGFLVNENVEELLKGGSSYKLAVFCPTEREPIRQIPYVTDDREEPI